MLACQSRESTGVNDSNDDWIPFSCFKVLVWCMRCHVVITNNIFSDVCEWAVCAFVMSGCVLRMNMLGLFFLFICCHQVSEFDLNAITRLNKGYKAHWDTWIRKAIVNVISNICAFPTNVKMSAVKRAFFNLSRSQISQNKWKHQSVSTQDL